MSEQIDAILTHVARVICAHSNIAPKDSPVPIFDVPDDLVWLPSPNGPVLAARWHLYLDRARAALDSVGYWRQREVLQAILEEVRQARIEDRLPDLALVEKLASSTP